MGDRIRSFGGKLKGTSPHAESLLKVLSLQVTTRARARSAADDLQPFILEDADFPGVAPLEDSVSEEKNSILKLILSAQELDPQCKRIFSQLRDHGTQSPSLALEQQQRLQLYSVDEDGLLKVAVNRHRKIYSYKNKPERQANRQI